MSAAIRSKSRTVERPKDEGKLTLSFFEVKTKPVVWTASGGAPVEYCCKKGARNSVGRACEPARRQG